MELFSARFKNNDNKKTNTVNIVNTNARGGATYFDSRISTSFNYLFYTKLIGQIYQGLDLRL